MLGIVDITGSANIASPYALALVRATARAAEAELAIRVAAADDQARRRYADRHVPERCAVALVSPGGRLLAATAAGRDCFAAEAADAWARMEEFTRLEALQHEVQAEIGQFRAADRLDREEIHDRAVH